MTTTEIKALVAKLEDLCEYKESLVILKKFFKSNIKWYAEFLEDVDDLIYELPEHIKIKEKMWDLLKKY